MKKLAIYSILLILAGLIFIRQVLVLADAVDKITWCHCEPNGNCQTLELPQQALENAGHVNASGNPLHAGDHAGACVEPTLVITPTIVITPQVTPTGNPTPTITQGVTPTPIAPTSVQPQPTGIQPTSEPKAGEPLPQGADQPALHGQGEPEKGGWK